MSAFLVFLSILVAVAGGLFVTKATLGVALIGAACYLGIVARILQADKNHDALAKHITAALTEHAAILKR